MKMSQSLPLEHREPGYQTLVTMFFGDEWFKARRGALLPPRAPLSIKLFRSACRSRRVGVVDAAEAGNGGPGESSRDGGGGRRAEVHHLAFHLPSFLHRLVGIATILLNRYRFRRDIL